MTSKLTFREEDHQYFWGKDEVPSVTQILAGAGLVDFSHVNEETLKQAADFGTNVHNMTALYDRGELDVFGLDAPLVPYLEAWRKFRKMSVQLLEDGSYKIAEYRDKSYRTVFLSCLNVVNFKKREGK